MGKIAKTNISGKVVKSQQSNLVVNSKIRGLDLDTSKFIYHETPTPSPDGSQKVFTCAYGYVAGLLEVFLDGLLQVKDVDYSETDNSAGTFTFVEAPDSNETIMVNYIKS